MKEVWEWLLDIKTLLAFLMIFILFLWYLTRDKDVLALGRDFAVAIISLATGYKLGKQNGGVPPVPPAEPKTEVKL